ncbi:MAG: S8 family peptidase [Candidatus Nanopelagicus sp.]
MKISRLAISVSLIGLVANLLVANSYAAGNPNCLEVDGDYIVTFSKGAAVANEIKNVNGRQVNPRYVYSEALNGFAGFLTGDQVCNLQKRGNVLSIEKDQEFSIQSVNQPDATWGLNRIDQEDLPLTGGYTYESEGLGVDVYVIDTGILSSHNEFTGTFKPGRNFVKDSRGTEDCNGHGTHVAGTIAGSKYGVAKQASVIPVRVLNCRGSGSTSDIIAGINWIITVNSATAIANLSLGGGASISLDAAVDNLIDDRVSVVVAAGNSSANACNYSPARVGRAITVAASDSSDKFATFSNFGNCVDLIAPGVSITSAWKAIGKCSSNCFNTINGTSMAAPHVAGVVARLLSAKLSSSVLTNASINKVTGLPSGTPNKLLYISPDS